ncbi:MAG: Stf0 family sulfotransferase [Pelagimonas sp.]|uniref:Stf0 family sulfotransferase n=1 Tax=Pelagimonas sp. TaxID=2073170 RepID=UPI003D6B7895
MSDQGGPRWDQFGAEYDQPPFVGKPKTYVIASSGRSGSHFLANLLFHTGQLGSPLEYLHPKHRMRWQKDLNQSNLRGTLRALMARRSSASGWFGIKAHWSQFSTVARREPLLRWLDVQSYIRLDRTDRVAQAVSMEIAKQTGAWISWQKPSQVPVFDRAAIAKTIEELETEDQAWDAFFSSVQARPIRVSYEDLTQDPQSVTASICKALDVPVPPAAVDLASAPKKQATTINDDWVTQYRSGSAFCPK